MCAPDCLLRRPSCSRRLERRPGDCRVPVAATRPLRQGCVVPRRRAHLPARHLIWMENHSFATSSATRPRRRTSTRLRAVGWPSISDPRRRPMAASGTPPTTTGFSATTRLLTEARSGGLRRHARLTGSAPPALCWMPPAARALMRRCSPGGASVSGRPTPAKDDRCAAARFQREGKDPGAGCQWADLPRSPANASTWCCVPGTHWSTRLAAGDGCGAERAVADGLSWGTWSLTPGTGRSFMPNARSCSSPTDGNLWGGGAWCCMPGKCPIAQAGASLIWCPSLTTMARLSHTNTRSPSAFHDQRTAERPTMDCGKSIPTSTIPMTATPW